MFHAQIHGVDALDPEMQAAARSGIQFGLELIGVRGESLVVENIATPFEGKPAAVFTGNLAASIASSYWMEPEGQAMVRIGVNPSLGADQYAAPVEAGAKAHMPPVDALIPWVIKKLNPKDEKQAMSMAWAVAKSIAKKGTQGHEMFSRALETLEGEAPDILEQQLAQAFLRAGFGGGAA